MSNDSLSSLLRDCIRPVEKNAVNASNSSDVGDQLDENENGAVIYIITVLTFYSLGVVVMIIQYLKTEKKELGEEKVEAKVVPEEEGDWQSVSLASVGGSG